MDTNLELYKIFLAVCKERSFSKAARGLYVSQPAVSQSISALERGLNAVLFSRNAKGVSMTAEGEMLYDYVFSALNLLETGEEKLLKMSKLQFGEVKIAAADTISRHYLLPRLDVFHKSSPNIKIQVVNRTTRQSIALLRSGAVDIAFVNLPVEEEGIDIVECMELHDIFVASERFSELRGEQRSVSELGEYPLIMLERASNSRLIMDRYFREHGVEAEAEIELGSHELLLEFAKIGLGISCVVREFSEEYLRSGAVFEIPLATPPPVRHMGMCSLSGVHMSLAAKEFVGL